MSSDTYTVTIKSVEGNKLILRSRTGTAAGLADYATSRSFVLSVLYDLGEEHGAIPVSTAVEGFGGEVWEEDFHQEHVGKFIESVTLLGRTNDAIDSSTDEQHQALYAFLNEVSEREDISEGDREEKLCERFHTFTLEAVMTDPKWLEGVEVGAIIPTTAFDAWWEEN